MATAAISPTSAFCQPRRRIVELVPGLLLLAAVGYAGKFIEQSIAAYTKSHHITFPNIEYVLWAIVIGLIIANTTGIPRIFQPGVATYEFWLKAGIVLLGSRFLLGDVLISAASRCCSSPSRSSRCRSPSCTARPRLQAQAQAHFAAGHRLVHLRSLRHHRRQAPSMPTMKTPPTPSPPSSPSARSRSSPFPLIGHSLHLSDKAYGLWAGLAVDNTAEATAAGALYSDAAGKVAVLAKTTRNASSASWCSPTHLLVIPRAGAGRRQQGRVPLAKIPQIRSRISLISLLATIGFSPSRS
jgi:hypothetical protein